MTAWAMCITICFPACKKSIRGSDPDAAVFYLARILEGGDLLSACRRLLVIASEDVGQAYPQAAILAKACTDAAKELGLPEGAIPLSNLTVSLATAPKSNSAYMAYAAAKNDFCRVLDRRFPRIWFPPLFKGYKYPHDYPNHYVPQQYLPNDLKGRRYYEYGENKVERAAKEYWGEDQRTKLKGAVRFAAKEAYCGGISYRAAG